MAATVETVAEHVQPLNGSIVLRGVAGSTLVAGQPITEASDGFFDPSDGSDTTLSFCDGIVLQDAVVGDAIDYVWSGPVQCMTGATVGALIYVSDTGGALSETAGTKSTIIGKAKTATVLVVRPQYVSLS
jgi:hypothetical protein